MVLIESESQVLATFPEDLRTSAMKQLQDLGVEVRTGVRATDLTEAGLEGGGRVHSVPCENLGGG